MCAPNKKNFIASSELLLTNMLDRKKSTEMSFMRSECLSLYRISWIYYLYFGLALIEFNAEAYMVGDVIPFENLCIQKCAEQVRYIDFNFFFFPIFWSSDMCLPPTADELTRGGDKIF